MQYYSYIFLMWKPCNSFCLHMRTHFTASNIFLFSIYNTTLQCRVRLRIINPSLRSCIGRSFMHRAALFFNLKYNNIANKPIKQNIHIVEAQKKIHTPQIPNMINHKANDLTYYNTVNKTSNPLKSPVYHHVTI